MTLVSTFASFTRSLMCAPDQQSRSSARAGLARCFSRDAISQKAPQVENPDALTEAMTTARAVLDVLIVDQSRASVARSNAVLRTDSDFVARHSKTNHCIIDGCLVFSVHGGSQGFGDASDCHTFSPEPEIDGVLRVLAPDSGFFVLLQDGNVHVCAR
jgi:hypothetical protein